MDIYPTLADLVGYNKKIRSWGRSLVSEKPYTQLLVNSDSVMENFIIGDNIYRFDGKNIVGVYDVNDLNMDHNLIDQLKTPEIEKNKMIAKAWYQDYMDRIINRKLH